MLDWSAGFEHHFVQGKISNGVFLVDQFPSDPSAHKNKLFTLNFSVYTKR